MDLASAVLKTCLSTASEKINITKEKTLYKTIRKLHTISVPLLHNHFTQTDEKL
jgi:hypothetical protein